ncbi:hypothetical protein NHP190012_11090 [Helicobacter sp. NHP19-012]|uniref:beta-lactamase n=1 Tax=Helicobacter gastrofelis TaxID=2849642 RepID=A0ABM7SHR4_9HELI|nr:SEL1-like repeat protein [Helicobacter sp. NHP19-012]BCZ19467.1 hypothetical protein NHP190012_11090 [Helicobacter sp. NHP19-012]
MLADLSGGEHINLDKLHPIDAKNKINQATSRGIVITALRFLGQAYQEGFGVQQDLQKARAFLQKGADFGDLMALAALKNIDKTHKINNCSKPQEKDKHGL